MYKNKNMLSTIHFTVIKSKKWNFNLIKSIKSPLFILLHVTPQIFKSSVCLMNLISIHIWKKSRSTAHLKYGGCLLIQALKTKHGTIWILMINSFILTVYKYIWNCILILVIKITQQSLSYNATLNLDQNISKFIFAAS